MPKTRALCLASLLMLCGMMRAQQYDKVWAGGWPVSTMTFDDDSVEFSQDEAPENE